MISYRGCRARAVAVVAVVALGGVLSSGCSFRPASFAATCTPVDSPVPVLRASPGSHSDLWVRRGAALEFSSLVFRSDCVALGGLAQIQVVKSPDWTTVTLSDFNDGGGALLTITVDTTAIPMAERVQGIVQLRATDPSTPIDISVTVWVVDLREFHVGLQPDSCPHTSTTGATVSVCDRIGPAEPAQLFADNPSGGLRVFLHDDGGEEARYDGPLNVPANTWLSAALGSDAKRVVVYCNFPPSGTDGAIALAGDHIRVERLSITLGRNCGGAISAWPSGASGVDQGTGWHLIENIEAFAMTPERFGNNGIGDALYLARDITVRNSHFYGYFTGCAVLAETERVRVIGNTFVLFDEKGTAPLKLGGSSDAVFANNIVLAPVRNTGPLARANGATTRVTIVGNLIDGLDGVVAGLDGLDNSVVADNTLGTAPLVSPFDPRFLTDATMFVGSIVAGEGTSLDGEDIAGATNLRPGAYQVSSPRMLPRPSVVTVGVDQCGVSPCDFTQELDNEIQLAVWSTWPGGTIEIYPATESYAGNAVISWGISMRGTGRIPEDAVLEDIDEALARDAIGWTQTNWSMISIVEGNQRPVLIENLTLLAPGDGGDSNAAISMETAGFSSSGRSFSPDGMHQLRRLRVEGIDNSSRPALRVGNRTLIQDTLISGSYSSCISFDVRSSTSSSFPEVTGWVMNVTCRLRNVVTGDVGFDVGRSNGSVFVNVAAELLPTNTANLFYSELGLQLGDIQVLHTVAYGHLADVDPDPGNLGLEIDRLDTPFFAGFNCSLPTDSDRTCNHLDESKAGALDDGADPASLSSIAAAPLQLGVSLNGVDRGGRQVDRGAYEQGN